MAVVMVLVMKQGIVVGMVDEKRKEGNGYDVEDSDGTGDGEGGR